MSKKELKVCWLSAGVSSFIAGYLKKDSIDLYIYIDIENQHPDSMRFIKDCEKILGKEILILKSPYRNKENVIRQFRYINGPSGAKCTEILKKRVRKEWEMEHREYQITYVWGFDMDERRRAERICEAMPEFKHEFPLIEKNLTKQDAHAITARLHVNIYALYNKDNVKMGYRERVKNNDGSYSWKVADPPKTSKIAGNGSGLVTKKNQNTSSGYRYAAVRLEYIRKIKVFFCIRLLKYTGSAKKLPFYI